MHRFIKFVVIGLAFFAPSLVFAAEFTVSVEKGNFLVDGTPILSGCFQRLMTELNGDDVTRSVYLTRSAVRGCMNANSPGRDAKYKILKDSGDGIYDVRVCEAVDGSMGANCATLIVRFSIYPYLTGKASKKVLSIDKLGER